MHAPARHIVPHSAEPVTRESFACRAKDILDRLAEAKDIDSAFIVSSGAGQLVKSLRAHALPRPSPRNPLAPSIAAPRAESGTAYCPRLLL